MFMAGRYELLYSTAKCRMSLTDWIHPSRHYHHKTPASVHVICYSISSRISSNTVIKHKTK